MSGDVALPLQDFHQRIQFQVAARGKSIFLSASNALVVIVPGFLVVARFGEGAAYSLFNTHARRGITIRRAGSAEIRTLRIFTEGKLDAGQRAFKRQLRRGLSPAQFDDDGLAADGIGGTVQNVRSRDAAGEVAEEHSA